jgi:hypothetical protein
VAPDPEGTPEERRALEAGIAKLAEQIKKEFGSEDTMDDLKLSDAERAVIQSIRAKQAAQAEAITTRETRTATAIKVLAMSNAEVTAMSSSERDHTISELAALLSDIGTE